MSKTSFTSADAMIASAIAGVTVVLVAGILLSAEHVKRDSAESIVESVAAANRKRLEAGKPAVTGHIDDVSVLVTEGEVEAQEWANLPYSFSGAESPRDPCILAVATRRTDGQWGTQRKPYSAWGVCASAKGAVAPFEGGCALDCREPEPPPPPPVVTPTATPVAAAPTPTPTRRIKTPLVEAPTLSPQPTAKPKGCSVTGCFGTTCCDEVTDACVQCPGSACCPNVKDCGGICQTDDDCTIGCGCVKLPGSPTGNCRGK